MAGVRQRNSIWYLSLLSIVLVAAGIGITVVAVTVVVVWGIAGRTYDASIASAVATAGIGWCFAGLAGLVLCRIALAVERIADGVAVAASPEPPGAAER